MAGKISADYALCSELVRKLREEPWSPEEEAFLRRCVRKVIAKGHYWPDGVYDDIRHCQSAWAPELVILRETRGSDEILLALYEAGQESCLGMWHIPGGYDCWAETIREGCSRIAKRELGVDVAFRRVLDALKWDTDDHPLSVFVECAPIAPIAETERLCFFPVNRLPEPMVKVHRQFIESRLP